MKHSTPPLKDAQALRQKARELGETARVRRARAHQAFDKTRQVIKDTEEIFQHNQAQRERQAEQGVLRTPTTPRAVREIVLIEDSSADVHLFRLALKMCAFSCQVTVLSERSEVETFVRQAATSAPLSLPQLIIADSSIPGMEIEEILVALRTVPAYESIPVILFSSLEEAEGQRRSAQCGATGYVRKPGELEAFVRAVATMVHRWGGGNASQDPGQEALIQR